MSEDRDQAPTTSPDNPEERAFSGAPDGPPQQPDQPAGENQELDRGGEAQKKPAQDEAGEKNPHGGYGDLPGYGG